MIKKSDCTYLGITELSVWPCEAHKQMTVEKLNKYYIIVSELEIEFNYVCHIEDCKPAILKLWGASS